MNSFIDRLLAHTPGGIPQDRNDIPALSFSGVGFVSLNGNTMIVSSRTATVTIDLHSLTVAQIPALLPSDLGASVVANGSADLLLLPSGATQSALPVTMTLPSNPLHYMIGMMANVLETRRRNVIEESAQINLAAATGNLLDFWGATVAVDRLPNEPDNYYSNRIIGLKFRKNVNNLAIDQFFKTLGYESTTTDTAPFTFQTVVNLSVNQPTATTASVTPSDGGFIADTSYLASVLNQLKAAGITAVIVLQYSLADTMVVLDNVQTIVYVPNTGQKWGSGRVWGRGLWYPPSVVIPPPPNVTTIDMVSGSDGIIATVTSPPYQWGENRKWGQGSYST